MNKTWKWIWVAGLLPATSGWAQGEAAAAPAARLQEAWASMTSWAGFSVVSSAAGAARFS